MLTIKKSSGGARRCLFLWLRTWIPVRSLQLGKGIRTDVVTSIMPENPVVKDDY